MFRAGVSRGSLRRFRLSGGALRGLGPDPPQNGDPPPNGDPPRNRERPPNPDPPRDQGLRRRRERAVPVSRAGRAAALGGLALELGLGALAEAARTRLWGQERHRGPGPSPPLSEATAERLVAALSRARGAALKVGQLLSMADSALLTPQLQRILAQLRRSADPMPAWQSTAVLDAELGPGWREQLQEFQKVPVAAASLGQVHRARLRGGADVAIKVQYPGVARSIGSDIENLLTVLSLSPGLPKGLFAAQSLRALQRELELECDYEREARSARRFRFWGSQVPAGGGPLFPGAGGAPPAQLPPRPLHRVGPGGAPGALPGARPGAPRPDLLAAAAPVPARALPVPLRAGRPQLGQLPLRAPQPHDDAVGFRGEPRIRAGIHRPLHRGDPSRGRARRGENREEIAGPEIPDGIRVPGRAVRARPGRAAPRGALLGGPALRFRGAGHGPGRAGAAPPNAAGPPGPPARAQLRPAPQAGGGLPGLRPPRGARALPRHLPGGLRELLGAPPNPRGRPPKPRGRPQKPPRGSPRRSPRGRERNKGGVTPKFGDLGLGVLIFGVGGP